MNDIRPVALTSAVMKAYERIVLKKISILLKYFTDPLQFTFKRNRCIDDAVLYVLQRVYSHLEVAGNTIRLMFLTSPVLLILFSLIFLLESFLT